MSYVHHIPGRIRIRTAGAKRDPHRSRVLELCLLSLQGVDHAAVNPVTGNALIHYRPELVDGAGLIEQMREREWIPAPAQHQPASALRIWLLGIDRAEFRRALARRLLESLAQAAVERCVVALVAALL